MVIGVQGILPLVHVMGFIDPVHGDLRQAVHGVILVPALGPCRVGDGDDVAVPVQGIAGRVPVPVGDGYDLPVLVITEVFRVPLRVGLRYRAVQGVILIGTFSK